MIDAGSAPVAGAVNPIVLTVAATPRRQPRLSARGQLVLDLESDTRWVRTARSETAHVLVAWKIPRAIDEAQLIVSELVTNAVVHANGKRIEWVITYGESRLLIEVRDDSGHPPAPAPDGVLEEGGRGLLMVHTITADWGWWPLGEQSKSTWAVLSVRGGEPCEPVQEHAPRRRAVGKVGSE
ncbi:ATP-binding protein [Streptomyces flavidovirens]|uniref:ATP-binding protein n=1 Tax=Streptomyces flavidovirens TaxID=67298 RepID=UPI0036D0D760